MTDTYDYGNLATFSGRLATADMIGHHLFGSERGWLQRTVDTRAHVAMADDLQNTINTALPAGLTYDRGRFWGPAPHDTSVVDAIQGVVDSIDLDTIVARHNPDLQDRGMTTLAELSSKAHVYRFGARWHWKCGATREQAGRCLGGPTKTQEEAYRAAYDHISDEHCELFNLPTDPDGCRYCGVVLAAHGLEEADNIGLHGYRAPTGKQRAMRIRQRRPVSN